MSYFSKQAEFGMKFIRDSLFFFFHYDSRKPVVGCVAIQLLDVNIT